MNYSGNLVDKDGNKHYIDSSGVTYNRETLNNVLTSMQTTTNNIATRITGYGDQAQQIDDPDNLGFMTGFYRYYGAYGNLPHSWYFIIHMGHYDQNGNYARQIWFNYFGIDCYTRRQTNGVWSGFQQIQLVGS